MIVAKNLIFRFIMKKGVVPVQNPTMVGIRFFLLRSTLGLVHRNGKEHLSDCFLGREAATMLLAVSWHVEDKNTVFGLYGVFHDLWEVFVNYYVL